MLLDDSVNSCSFQQTTAHFMFMQGAVFVDWTRDGIDPDADVPVQLQMDPDLFAAAMEAKGVASDKPVVVSAALTSQLVDSTCAQQPKHPLQQDHAAQDGGIPLLCLTHSSVGMGFGTVLA